jgi:hypothetical protein
MTEKLSNDGIDHVSYDVEIRRDHFRYGHIFVWFVRHDNNSARYYNYA